MSNYSEFSRLRSIAQKRINRLSGAGFIKPYKIPTVADIKSGKANYSKLLSSITDFLGSGNVLRTVRKTGEVQKTALIKTEPKRARKPLTPEQRERKNRRARERYGEQKQQQVLDSLSKEQQRLLKSARTIINNWKKAGISLGKDAEKILKNADLARAFVEYTEYRFAQADYNMMYVIDDFVEGFVRLIKKHSASNIIKDFNNFLIDRESLEEAEENMIGIPAEDSLALWDEFINK